MTTRAPTLSQAGVDFTVSSSDGVNIGPAEGGTSIKHELNEFSTNAILPA
jgi:hypothetical protein